MHVHKACTLILGPINRPHPTRFLLEILVKVMFLTKKKEKKKEIENLNPYAF